MKISEQSLGADGNNFTATRLVLATSVIYTHCYYMAYKIEGVDDLSGFLGAPISAYAVDGFFFLSGFLVYPSLLRLGSAVRFLTARFVRLWPALAACVLLTVAAGAMVTTAPGLSYLGGDTLRFILGNLSFVSASYLLTGVNCEGAPCSLNGSLWTLPWEVRCYLLLALLGALGLHKPNIMKWVILPLSALGAIAWDIPLVQGVVGDLAGDGAVYLLGVFDRLWTVFALGIAAYLFRDRIKLSWWILAGLFAANIAAQHVGLGLHARGIFIGYAVLCAGFLTARRRAVSATWPDYSYGSYIYGYPVMVAIYAVWPTQSHLALTVATIAGTLPLAALSWHLLEQPALDAYRQRRRKAQLSPQT